MNAVELKADMDGDGGVPEGTRVPSGESLLHHHCEVEKMLHEAVMGKRYRYVAGYPVGCHGHLYFAHRHVMDVPSYQHKVLLEALTGPDKGLWFTCTLNNFLRRYEEVESENP